MPPAWVVRPRLRRRVVFTVGSESPGPIRRLGLTRLGEPGGDL
jgi:hypothetical protein